ncbi:MAG TPA: tRNA (adenosine(37)-N6)-threonylcarbamoyltransferase complex ATPase subunit type 1 TsaE [Bryobacteraceae bacterium]|jgi:tRNA threonylcarbamoyladenosine biosynthesis protein TsaE|nr:tRNA (adenosine(37)-N6)-threonylcarbamoyltransferase complex ATPase subunit type 1 TsaE [Bryobacteraceae bacterium]
MKSDLRFETASEEETLALGRRLARVLPETGVVLLIGELGAGKTTLTKGIAEGRSAALAQDVTSPTFTLIHEYGDPPSVYHVDFYRLDTQEQASRIGLEELFTLDALVLVEWGDRFPELFPPATWTIRIQQGGADHRIFQVSNGIKP